MTQAEFFTGLSMCAVALWFAAHSSISVRQCAVAFFFGWMAYVSAWSSDIHPTLVSPASWLYAHGFDAHSEDIWIVADVLCGLFVMERAALTWWGRSLWISYITQGAFHIWYKNGLDWEIYQPILTGVFWGQVAIFIMVGMPHVRDRCLGAFDRWRNALDKSVAIPKEAIS